MIEELVKISLQNNGLETKVSVPHNLIPQVVTTLEKLKLELLNEYPTISVNLNKVRK